MIGKSEWFQRRKYGGWGLSPKAWQGWAYTGLMILITLGLMQWSPVAAYVFIGVMCLDVIHLMMTLKKDELEVKMEALAERNAAWAMIGIIVVGVGFQSVQSAITGRSQLDYFLVAALFGGVIAKAATNLWLERKGV
jgi:hypothetical protein